MMATDVDRLRRDVSLAAVASGYGVKLEKDGYEFIACCPFHAEDTPSFTIFRGKDGIERFHCFGCGGPGGKGGDVLDFVRGIKGVNLPEAIRILGGGTAGPNIAPRVIAEPRDIYAGIEPLTPAGEIVAGRKVNLYNPKRAGTEREWGSFAPSMVFPYRRADGSLIAYVLRHELRDGGKETPMVMWARLPNGKEAWCRYPFPKPRTIYGLEDLGDARQVIVVEGEKCRDKLRRETGRTVVSWAGGTYGIRHTDWSPLAGRNVVIWPDADKPGLDTANEIAATLRDLGCTVRVIDVDGAPLKDGDKDGWDCADWIDKRKWGKTKLDTYMRERVRMWSPDGEKPAGKPAERLPDPAPPQAPAKVETRAVERERPQEPIAKVDVREGREPVKKNSEPEGIDIPTGSSVPLKDHPLRDGILALREWVFLSADCLFYNRKTGEMMNKTAFDMAFATSTPMVEVMDKDGGIELKKYPASKTLIEFFEGEIASAEMYRPDAEDVFFEREGIRYVNAYLSNRVPEADANWRDGKAWRMCDDHIRNILPNDADLVIKWMAYNVQKPGRKVRWSPVIVGVQGDGKTTISDMLKAAMGYRNVKPVSPEAMFSDFNGWAEGACVRVLEEIRVQGERRSAAMDKLKPLITNNDIEVVRKGRDGQTVANVTNYLALTNHIDALAIDEGDRRWAVMKTRFKTREQMTKELTDEYFIELHNTIGNDMGAIRGWLLSVDLSDFNYVSAPEINDAKHMMIEAARSGAEADVREAIAVGGEGVGADVLATACLNEVVKGMGGRALNTSSLANILRECGWTKYGPAIKWNGKSQRVYYRADLAPEDMNEASLKEYLRHRLDMAGRETPAEPEQKQEQLDDW